MEEIDAVIFDVDDTLLDRSKTFDLYSEYLINTFFPKGINDKDNIKLEIKEFDKNGYEGRNTFYRKIINNWKLKYEVNELENNWFERFDSFSVPECKLKETLEYLRQKYKMAIITNGSSIMQNKKINALGIRKYFDEIIISNDVGMKKPDRNIFLAACKRLDVIPEKSVYVGDNYTIDVAGAINAGLNAVWINKFETTVCYRETIHKLADLMKIL